MAVNHIVRVYQQADESDVFKNYIVKSDENCIIVLMLIQFKNIRNIYNFLKSNFTNKIFFRVNE